jgi:hypothetical protein
MHIEESVRKSEGLSKKEAARLEKMFEEIEAANPSMPPNIYAAKQAIVVDTSQGGQSIDADLFPAGTIKKLQKLGEKLVSAPDTGIGDRRQISDEIIATIGDYLEAGSRSMIYSVEIESGGWMANLSMPGYMDQTEPTHYKTLKEAIEGLHDMYGDIE